MERSNEKLWERVDVLTATVTKIETRMEEHAPRRWVEQLIQPIKEAVMKIEVSIASMSQKTEQVLAAHDALLKDQSAREQQTLKDQTISALVKKYGALSGAIGAIWFLLTVARALFESWLKARGLQ